MHRKYPNLETLTTFSTAIVSFKLEKEAKKVIEDLNGFMFLGQKMSISLDKLGTTRNEHLFSDATVDMTSTTLFVSGLPPGVTKKIILSYFREFGLIVAINVAPNNRKYVHFHFRHYLFCSSLLIDYTRPVDAQNAARKMDGQKVEGNNIYCFITKKE